MSQPESLLVGRIRRAIAKEFPGAYHVKIAGGRYQNAGLPDLFLIVEGRAVGLEVKCQRPGESEAHARERATPRQLSVLAQMAAAGAVTAVVLSPEEALAAVRLAAR